MVASLLHWQSHTPRTNHELNVMSTMQTSTITIQSEEHNDNAAGLSSASSELPICALLASIRLRSSKATTASISQPLSTAISWRTAKTLVTSNRWCRKSKWHQIEVSIALRLLLLLLTVSILHTVKIIDT